MGNAYIIEGNFNPCKYTRIDAEYSVDDEIKKIQVFNEEVDPKTFPVNVIGGERTVKLTLHDYTPNKCRLREESHEKEKFAYFKKGDNKLPVSNGVISDVKVRYLYNPGNLISSLWLPRSAVQHITLCMDRTNCRYHHHEVTFNMYPDIKWEAFVELGSSDSRAYSHTNMPAAYEIFKRHQEKALSSAKKKKDIALSFGLLATYDDDKTIELSADIEKSVEVLLGVLAIIRDGLDTISFKKTVDKNKDALKARNILPKNAILAPPFFIEISSPVIQVGGGWQYALDSSNQLIRKGEIAIAASPLIEAKGGLDLIAVSTYIPAVGQIIKAILKINDLGEWLTKRMSGGKAKYEGLIWFNLYLQGSLSIEGTIELSQEDQVIGLKSPATIIFGVELGLSAEVKVDTVSIKGSTTHTVRAGMSGEAKIGLTFEPSLGYSVDKGMYLGLDVRFDGIVVSVQGEAKYEKGREGKKEHSVGVEVSKDYPLVPPCSIWKGEVYPFNNS